MNQVDLVVLTFILFGGWLGAVKGSVRAFVSLAGTVLGLAVAGLYAPLVANTWERFFSFVAERVSLQFPWVAAVSTQTAWQQSAHIWLRDLLWPIGLKRLIAEGWRLLPDGETLAGFTRVVERGFFLALANICAFITLLLLSKAAVAVVTGISFRLVLSERQSLSPVGLFVGMLQNLILVIAVLALLVPFFLWISQVPLSQVLEPSLAWRAVQWFWESILRI